ncbi:MAG TPA: methylated-DNA--[protein]-cysteine S-methyltransferase [Candidatus Binatia bacterium]|nr:methylated-DNA--[protein]-cysteine S-methyltransferase [Candidatus Binatia bacterium]
MTPTIAEIATPIGALDVVLDGDSLLALLFADRGDRTLARLERQLGSTRSAWRPAPRTSATLRRIRDYFAGDLSVLDEIEIAPHGTPFQLAVWKRVRQIPVGETASYSDVARDIRAPAAVRAVGAANGANPICIVVPCHRVIGATGDLTGYGGGLDRKRWLLSHESRQPALAAAAR